MSPLFPELEKIASSDTPGVPAMHGCRLDVFGKPAMGLKRGEIALALEDGKVVARPVS